MTTYSLERTDTGEHLDAYQIRGEIDRLDGAATEAPVRVGGWTPNPDYYIPDHVATLLGPLTREQLDAEDTPQAGDNVPSTGDLTRRIDLGYASYRLMRHQEVKAELWHAEASRMWAEQGAVSRISEHYTDRREALLSAYEAECERLKARVLAGRPLDQAPGLAGPVYGGHVYTEERGYVQADRIAQDSPADVSGQNREAHTPTSVGSGAETSQSPLNGPEDRQPSPPGAHRTLAEVHDGVRRDALTTGEQPTQADEPEPPRVGGWRVWAASAAIGIVGLAAAIGALAVWA